MLHVVPLLRTEHACLFSVVRGIIVVGCLGTLLLYLSKDEVPIAVLGACYRRAFFFVLRAASSEGCICMPFFSCRALSVSPSNY